MTPSEQPSVLEIGVLVGDPRLPYSFSETGWLGDEEHEAARHLEHALDTLTGYRFRFFDNHETLIDDLRAANPGLVLNFCDTGYRNDTERVTNIPALLEVLGIPYTGCGAFGLNLSADKECVHALASSLGIPVPNEVFVDLTNDPLVLPPTYPALIKPNLGAGSYAVSENSVVNDGKEAEAYMHWLAQQIEPARAVIGEFLTGPEYTVGVIGNPGADLTVLPPAELDFSGLDSDLPPLFTYKGKFDATSRYWQQLRHKRARLDERTHAQVVHYCTVLFRRLGFRDCARFDFRAGSDGVLRLLDANPNPTWYWDSRMAMMAKWAGYDYAAMLEWILRSARRRYGL